jgi:hypothetical protein
MLELIKPMVNATDEEIQALIDGYDIETLVAEEVSKFTVIAWDKKSPINGVEASTVLSSRPEIKKTSKPYLIADETGTVLYFQTHKRAEQGFVEITDAVVEGTDHALEIATSNVNGKIINEIIQSLQGE